MLSVILTLFIICLNLLDFHGSVFLSPIFNDLVHFILYIFTLFEIILHELLIKDQQREVITISLVQRRRQKLKCVVLDIFGAIF